MQIGVNNSNIKPEDTIDLFDEQLEEWQLFSDNYDEYNDAPHERILCGHVFWEIDKVLLNYRKKSITADLKTIEEGKRACFLCPASRPAEQRWLEWRDYEILVNPYPVSPIHFTVACRMHVPQKLGDRIMDMSKLSGLVEESCVFYNGAKCGASAPDHMHFQIVDEFHARNFMIRLEYFHKGPRIGESRIYMPHINMSPFGYYLMDIRSEKDILPMYRTIIGSLNPDDGASEPMMNVLAFKADDSTRIAVIPRKKHRPSFYGAGTGQMLVSPASVEMMGTFIASREEDFERLNENVILRIYNEVGYSHEEFQVFINRLQS